MIKHDLTLLSHIRLAWMRAHWWRRCKTCVHAIDAEGPLGYWCKRWHVDVSGGGLCRRWHGYHAWLYNLAFRWLHRNDAHVRVWQEGEQCSGCDNCKGALGR